MTESMTEASSISYRAWEHLLLVPVNSPLACVAVIPSLLGPGTGRLSG